MVLQICYQYVYFLFLIKTTIQLIHLINKCKYCKILQIKMKSNVLNIYL